MDVELTIEYYAIGKPEIMLILQPYRNLGCDDPAVCSRGIRMKFPEPSSFLQTLLVGRHSCEAFYCVEMESILSMECDSSESNGK